MIESLLLIAQAQDYCARRTPIVVCVKFIQHEQGKAPQYFVKQTNGGREMQINRCSWLHAKIDEPLTYVPEEKWCPDEN
jgi:hypothetical protein